MTNSTPERSYFRRPQVARAPLGLLRSLVLLLLLFGSLLGAFATPAAPVPRVDELSLDQQVGLLLLPRVSGTYLADDDPELVQLMELARRGHIGGAILFAGDPLAARSTITRLQEAAPHRLLFGLDAEWGTAMRLSGTTQWPRAMAVGATGDPDLSYEMGRVTAREARSIGIDLVLAPVADLALRSDNRVIGSRSFGSDPESVGAHVASFVIGVRDQGAVAVVKHFPGHGATADDSHTTLPVLDISADLLHRRELVPFRAAVAAGVDAVMPGHLAVPSLDASGLPASLSPVLLQDVLRQQLGFEGLIVSDALDMSGARAFAWDARVAAQALKAGVDLLLLPTDPQAARLEILRSLRRGDLSQERLSDAVSRTLEAHRKLALSAPDRSQLTSLNERQLAAEAARDSVSMIDSPKAGVLPLNSWQPPHVGLIELDHHPSRRTIRPLASAIARRAAAVTTVRLRPGQERGDLADQEDVLSRADVLVVVLQLGGPDHCANPDCTELVEASQGLLRALSGLQSPTRPVVLVSLADPWPLLAPTSRLFAARLSAYEGSHLGQEAVAAALFGEHPIRGTLPLAAAERSAHLPASPMQKLREGAPEEAGMSSAKLNVAAEVLERAIAEGSTPGAVALVARRGVVVFHRAFGRLARPGHQPAGMRLTDPQPPAVTRDSLFDLASLTKVVATTTLAMRLVEQDRLDLHALVVDYIPEFRNAAPNQQDRLLRSEVRVRDLLTHSSGMLWWTDLHLRHGVQLGNSPQEARDAYLREVYELPLESAPRTEVVYSDLGILLLSEVLERVSGTPFHHLVDHEILEPLNLRNTLFRPTPALASRTLPTEFDPWRNRVVWAEVHDENAAGLAGLAPHAGLFATASDLAKFNQMLLAGGAYDGQRFLNGNTIAQFVTRDPSLPDGSTRALGWDTPSAKSSGGRFLSEHSFGHTGFTGTSIWLDPERDLQVVLLTNRVHPSRDDIRIRDLRPAFHDAVMASITDADIRPRAGSEPR